MALFKNKYRIETTRLRSWDYGNNAAYFVTICTWNRHKHFGEIANDETQLSSLGIVANNCWEAIPEHFPFVTLGAYIVMPNHVHGIIIIDKPFPVETQNLASKNDIQNAPVETQNLASLQFASLQQGNQFGPQSKNLGSIIRGYKIGVTKYAKQNKINFKWQARFHDHIIRNEEEYMRIHNYIVTNPQNWNADKFYKGYAI